MRDGGSFPMYVRSNFAQPNTTNKPTSQLVTGYIQRFLYTLFIRAGDPKPVPGSARFINDRRRILIFVILTYLCYTIYEADHQLQQTGDFYTLLGVPHSATEREIQSRFRRLTVQYHPDKAAPGADHTRVEAVYVALQLAKDTLTDHAKRFAYDRFGSAILGWQSCRTTRDYVFTALQSTGTYYVGSAASLVLLGMLGFLRQGMFWRYLIMAGMFVVEVQVMTRPRFPAVLTGVVNPMLVSTGLRPPYLPFQMVSLLRQVVVTSFIALAQLGPMLQAQTSAQQEGEPGGAVSSRQLDTVDAIATAIDSEAGRLMGLELMPFVSGGAASVRELRTSLKEWLVQHTIRSDPELRTAITSVLEQRRAGMSLHDRPPPVPPHSS